ncbi:MAG: hypothetical protein ACP5SH_09355 [Syntrophobacteraceae bacterium]
MHVVTRAQQDEVGVIRLIAVGKIAMAGKVLWSLSRFVHFLSVRVHLFHVRPLEWQSRYDSKPDLFLVADKLDKVAFLELALTGGDSRERREATLRDPV